MSKYSNKRYISKQTEINKGGTGIGLTLSKEFLKLNKCFLKVNSIEGKGSQFIITIPKIK